ncbi:MAG: YceI family protein [Bacteroidia bacterium]
MSSFYFVVRLCFALPFLVSIFFQNGMIKRESTQLHLPDDDPRLVLFYQDQDTHFIRTTLPFLQTLTAERGLVLVESKSSLGYPESVTATPAIFFVSKKGKAMFGGKYTEQSALENFVRVSKVSPIPPVADPRKDILVQKRKSQRVAIPLKVTSQQGNYAGENPNWESQLVKQIIADLPFVQKKEVQLWPSDRRFYLDVHPYVSQEGEVYVSAAIFSQFDCIKPIWENFEKPFSGKIAASDSILIALTKTVDRVVEKQLRNYDLGDALTPLPLGTKTLDWDDFAWFSELHSHHATKVYPQLEANVFEKPQPLEKDFPMLQFNFPAPLDRYAGEVKKLDATLAFTDDLSVLSGEFVAKVKSMTMGMKDLDAKVLKSYLFAKDFPEARFSFDDFELPVNWDGKSALAIRVPGTFEMMDKSQAMIVDAFLEPVMNGKEAVSLQLTASFSLDIARPYGLKGPDGPETIRNTLQFRVHCILDPQ